MNKQHDESTITHQPEASSLEHSEKVTPIEVKWNIPQWLMRFPGPCVETPDDDVAFEEGA